MPEDKLQSTIQDFLNKIGISSRSLYRLRLGHGVVGKLSILAIVVVIVLGAIACKLGNLWLGAVVVIFISFYAFYAFKGILNFADKYPDKALLEGAEFLIYHQKLPLGSKELPTPPPQTLLPQAEPSEQAMTPDLGESEKDEQ